MQSDTDEQIKTIAVFTAELIRAIENPSPLKREENWFEWYARMRGIDLDEISKELTEGRRRARMATVLKK
jgi:hypothetical protein